MEVCDRWFQCSFLSILDNAGGSEGFGRVCLGEQCVCVDTRGPVAKTDGERDRWIGGLEG